MGQRRWGHCFIYVWRLPGNLPFSKWPTYLNIDHCHESIKVSDLFSSSGVRALISSNRYVECLWSIAIKSIALSMRARQDRLGWGDNGANKVVVISLSSPRNGGRLDCIWKLRTSPRAKSLVWKIMLDIVSVISKLVERGMQINAVCWLCALKEESCEHVFYQCPIAW